MTNCIRKKLNINTKIRRHDVLFCDLCGYPLRLCGKKTQGHKDFLKRTQRVRTNFVSSSLPPKGAAFVFENKREVPFVIHHIETLHVTSYLNGTTHITGNVGIGSEPSLVYKLGVNGTIGCRKVVVTNTGWADYVFEQDYKLMPLNELESFIQDNKHLPEVPSASHVEENGVELSEMNVLLLKKVEELTLYILQQNQDIQTLKEEVQSLKEGR